VTSMTARANFCGNLPYSPGSASGSEMCIEKCLWQLAASAVRLCGCVRVQINIKYMPLW